MAKKKAKRKAAKKRQSDSPMMPSAEERRRWQAESAVSDAFKRTGTYKKAVNATMKDIEKQQKKVQKRVEGKKVK